MRRILLTLLCVFCSANAAAQTRLSGTSQCAKPDTSYSLAALDRPDHAFGITRIKCTWTKPLVIAGLEAKEDLLTSVSEVTGDSSTDRTFVVGLLSNGDKVFVRVQGRSALKGGIPQNGAGTWNYADGTGKAKGITGKGTYRCASNPDGTSTCIIEGDYQLPK